MDYQYFYLSHNKNNTLFLFWALVLVLVVVNPPSAIAFWVPTTSNVNTAARPRSCSCHPFKDKQGPSLFQTNAKRKRRENDDDDGDDDDNDDISDFFRQALSNAGGVTSFELPLRMMEEMAGGGDGVGGGGGGDDNGNNNNKNSKSADAAEDSLEALLSFDLKPKEVVEYLDRFVIQQDEAKKVLAVAICDHYNHCRRCLQQETSQRQAKQNNNDNDDDDTDIWALLEEESSSSSASSWEYAKPNVLLAGPTGVGKTYLLKCLARLVGVPFVKADATKFSETGIVGRDAEDLVRDLVDKANGNTTLASVGIIYLDEVDKIAAGSSGDTERKGSFNTRGVQNNFLKLLEDTEVNLERQTDMVITNLPGLIGGGSKQPKTISTKNILFIFSGAFTNLDRDIRRKKEQKPFGLDTGRTRASAAAQSSSSSSTKTAGGPKDDDNTKPRSYLRFAETSDFVRAGLEPEFVGRVPVRVALDALDADDLKQILVGAEGSVLKQFVRDMEGYDIRMTASDQALDEIAKRAEKEATGARGLVTILEQTLRQHKYELPSTSITEFVLDRETVMNPELALHRLLAQTTPDDDTAVLLRDLKRWEAKLNRQLPKSAKAWLTDDAINYMVLKSLEEQDGVMSAYSFATRHFGEKMLPAVIRRIHDATSQRLFPITIEVAKNPRAELKKWLDLVKQSSSISSPSPSSFSSTNSTVIDAEIEQ